MEIFSIALEKKINIYAVKGNWQLDQSIQSKIIAVFFSMAVEIERDLISQRTREALAAKKKQGELSWDTPEAQAKANLTPINLRLRRSLPMV
jgi:DNA invertase Pin-like site-specific DNA recombinase